MNANEIAVILADQREDYLNEDLSQYCSRSEEAMLSLESKLAQVVIGVRRCGKSTMCTKFLLEHSASCAYVNLDDERLAGLKREELNTLLEAIYIVYGDVPVLYFDEIQNVDGWPLFVNRLLRQKKHIFLTGSNSKLLSNELMTHLTGRHNKVELFPLSFYEYCQLRHIDLESITTKAEGLRKGALLDYISKGGFPELIAEPNRKGYIDGLFNSIIKNDIAKRFKIRNVDVLKSIASYLAENYAQEYRPKALAELFGVSNHTVDNYYGYLKEAFLLIGVKQFSYKAKERLHNEKCYVTDIALSTDHAGAFSMENIGWRLENAVCVELLRRYHCQYAEVYYFRNKSFEVDFVVAKDGHVLELIQVCYDLSSPKTLKRELKGLTEGAKMFRCSKLTLITLEQSEQIDIENYQVQVVPAVKWFCSRKENLEG